MSFLLADPPANYSMKSIHHRPLVISKTGFLSLFLDAPSHLYKRLCPSVRPSVGPSVRRSVCPVLFLKVKRTHTRRILCRVSGLVVFIERGGSEVKTEEDPILSLSSFTVFFLLACPFFLVINGFAVFWQRLSATYFPMKIDAFFWPFHYGSEQISSGFLACLFAHSLAPLTHSLAPHCRLHSRSLLRSFLHSFTDSLTLELMEK